MRHNTCMRVLSKHTLSCATCTLTHLTYKAQARLLNDTFHFNEVMIRQKLIALSCSAMVHSAAKVPLGLHHPCALANGWRLWM